MENRERLDSLLQGCGVRLWGACDFNPLAGRLLSCRAKARIPEKAASVLCAAFPYRSREPLRNVSYYAGVPDYHSVWLPVLRAAAGRLSEAFAGYAFEPFVDNSPIPEVYAAAMCGLGIVGDNGLLITPEYGSWVFLGEIVTDLPLFAGQQPVQTCPHCGRCRAACPGGALTGSKMEKSRCLSHLTQKKGTLSGEEAALVQKGELVWGCDRCQEVCTLNRGVKETDFPPFQEGRIPFLRTGDAARLTGRAFGWRPPEVIERNLRLLPSKDERLP